MDCTLPDDLFLRFLSLHGRRFTSHYLRFLHRLLLSTFDLSKIQLGIELEFYLDSFGRGTEEDVLSEAFSAFKTRMVAIKREVGDGQYEAIFLPSPDLVQVCETVLDFMRHLRLTASRFGAVVYFHSRPFSSCPPSSMQFSLSLVGHDGVSTIGSEADIVNIILKALLFDMKGHLVFLAPTARCYSRLSDLDGARKFRNFPVNVSWGYGQNRTVAIRLVEGKMLNDPLNSKDSLFFNEEIYGVYDGRDDRIEHRVPSCMTDPYCAMIAFLTSCITAHRFKSVELPSPVYGNAFESQVMFEMSLSSFPSSARQSSVAYVRSDFCKAINELMGSFIQTLPGYGVRSSASL